MFSVKRVRGTHLSGHHDKRRTIGQRVLHRGDGVGCTGARSYDEDSWLARHARVSLRHVATALLVSWEAKVKLLRVVNGVKHWKNGSACDGRRCDGRRWRQSHAVVRASD